MRVRTIGYLGLVAAPALVVAACALTPSPSPEVSAGAVCPEAQVTNLPSTFSAQPPVSAGAPGRPSGLRRTYTDPAGREFSILSGMEGELGGRDSGERLVVRGHEASILVNAETDTLIVVWREAPPDQPCSQYAAIGTGLPRDEFLRYVSGIR